MSTISTIEDALITRLQALFPNHQRLTNSYSVGENNDRVLRQAWGLALGEGSSPRELLSKQLSILREVRVVLTRKAYAKETDVTGKVSAEKSLLEDQFLVIKDFDTNTTLNGTASLTKYISDSGITFVSGEREQFLSLETHFSVEYFEDLN
jgi:hypothetical protein